MTRNSGHYILAKEIRVYYARAMDGLESGEITQDDTILASQLGHRGLQFNNPHCEAQSDNRSPREIVEDNLALLKESSVLLANLAREDYLYIGAVFEVAQAVALDIPVVICMGNRDLASRVYLRHYANFLCRDLGDAVEYIWRCWTAEGIQKQLCDAKAFYDAIACVGGRTSGKPYDAKEQDIERYTVERDGLKESLRHYCRGRRVLELGCGEGEWTQVIAEVADSVTCIEASPNMIAAAENRLKGSRIQPDFINGDFFDGGTHVGSFDVVVVYFTLSFLPPPSQSRLLWAMRKWVSPDGVLLFAESARIANLPTIGLGHARIQTRKVLDREYLIYKEQFSSASLDMMLKTHGFQTIELMNDTHWFVFCAVRT